MMTRLAMVCALAAVVSWPALAPNLALADEEGHALEQLVIEMAQTPEQHQALARHFRAKAEAARKDASEHQQMARSYGGQTKLALRRKMQRHCRELAEKQAAVADQFAALAELHEQEAQQAGSTPPQ